MTKRWTRRRFLAVAGGTTATGLVAKPSLAAAAKAPSLARAERATLRAFADEIIPAGNAMPSATEAGAAGYIETLAAANEEVRAQVQGALRAIDEAARVQHRRPFARLDGPRRLELLRALEKTAPDTFQPARNLVYEGYYTQAVVQQRLGYEFIPADGKGPPLEPFDDTALERVKGMRGLYRTTS